jgi:hypothetical protein
MTVFSLDKEPSGAEQEGTLMLHINLRSYNKGSFKAPLLQLYFLKFFLSDPLKSGNGGRMFGWKSCGHVGDVFHDGFLVGPADKDGDISGLKCWETWGLYHKTYYGRNLQFL